MAELFAVRYSPAPGRLVSIMLLLAMTGFSATCVKSLTLLAQPLLPHVPFDVLSAALTATVLMGVLPGGLVSVVRSDVVSFLITLVILPGCRPGAGARDHARAAGSAACREPAPAPRRRTTPDVSAAAALPLFDLDRRPPHLASYAGLSWQGRWVWTWKDRIDRRFMRKYGAAPKRRGQRQAT